MQFIQAICYLFPAKQFIYSAVSLKAMLPLVFLNFA